MGDYEGKLRQSSYLVGLGKEVLWDLGCILQGLCTNEKAD